MSTSASVSAQHLTSQAISGQRASLLRRAIATDAGWPATLARVALAIVMFPHGAQKLLGWFGGYGFAGTFHDFTDGMKFPAPLAASVILIEFGAPILLLVGLGTRFAALGIGAIMVGAIATVHAANGLFMNWTGAQKGEGFEYHLLALALVGVLLLLGGGRASIDRSISSRRG